MRFLFVASLVTLASTRHVERSRCNESTWEKHINLLCVPYHGSDPCYNDGGNVFDRALFQSVLPAKRYCEVNYADKVNIIRSQICCNTRECQLDCMSVSKSEDEQLSQLLSSSSTDAKDLQNLMWKIMNMQAYTEYRKKFDRQMETTKNEAAREKKKLGGA